MKYFDKDIDWIFTFCKSCWDFKKFTFKLPIDFDLNESKEGECSDCKNLQEINVSHAKEYYENVNAHNN